MPTPDYEKWLEDLRERLAALRRTLEEVGEQRRRHRWRSDGRPDGS